MFTYFSKQFAASQAATRIVGVNCEQCGCRYFYELTRIGIGAVSTPYGLMATAAAQSAEVQSAAELSVRLSNEAELVPCPRCHWINAELVAGYRLSQYHWMLPLAVSIAFCGIVASLISAAFIWSGPPVDHKALPYVLIGGPGISLVAGLLIVLVRTGLRAGIRPNRNFPARPVIPRGTPAALLLDEATETFHKVEEEDASPPGECQWFDFQIGRHRLRNCCSQCLGTASDDALWTFPVTVAVQLSVPRCVTCRKRSRGEYLLAWLFAFVVSSGTGIGLLLLLPIDELIFWILAGCHGLLSLGVAAYYGTVQSAPARVRVVDRSRGILRLRFRNPEYRPESVWDS